MNETRSTDGLVCPHCGRLNTPDDSDYALYDEDISEFECVYCEKTIHVRVHTTWAWYGYETEEAADS